MTTETTTSNAPGYDFLKYILDSVVEDKDDIHIDSQVDDLGVLLTVQVSDRDMGKLIGKNGQTIKALRILLRIIGGNMSQRINLKILEPSEG